MATEIKPLITFEDIFKLDIRMGYVKEIAKIEKSRNLHVMQVDFGEIGIKQIVTNVIGNGYVTISQIENNILPFILNLPEVKMCNVKSQGMIVGMSRDGESFDVLSRMVVNMADIGSKVL